MGEDYLLEFIEETESSVKDRLHNLDAQAQQLKVDRAYQVGRRDTVRELDVAVSEHRKKVEQMELELQQGEKSCGDKEYTGNA